MVEIVPVTPVNTEWVHQHKVSVAVLRADLIDPQISGNKYFKLLPNIRLARAQQHHTLLSFGGPWSNHLHALAAAGQRYGLRTIGVVRGEQGGPLTACLQDAADFGMQLHFISRIDYGHKTDPLWQARLVDQFGPHYLIPEGGANRAGIVGCQQLLPKDHDYTHVVLACGTGATMAGVVSSSRVPVTGIQVLKGAGYLQREVAGLLQQHGLQATCDWQVLDDWHGGGYGRFSPQLTAFMQRFETETGIPLDPVYSGKMLQAVVALIAHSHFPAGARLLVIHGGGLQGRRSLG